MADEYSDVKLALEEMRFTMQQVLEAGNALDQKVSLVLVASGLMLAVATTLQTPASCHSTSYWAILFLAVGLYVTAAGIVLWIATPRSYRMAIAAEWNELDEHIFGKSERAAILSLLAGYVTQIRHNQEVNQKKAILLYVCLAMLALIVVLLVVLALIQ